MNDILADNSRQNYYSSKILSADSRDFTAALFSEKLGSDDFPDMYVSSKSAVRKSLKA